MFQIGEAVIFVNDEAKTGLSNLLIELYFSVKNNSKVYVYSIEEDAVGIGNAYIPSLKNRGVMVHKDCIRKMKKIRNLPIWW